MSKETTERGNQKRQAVRNIIYSVLMDCIREHKLLADTKRTIYKHIGVIKGKTKPQELSLVNSVIGEMQLDNPDWVKGIVCAKCWKGSV
jgi:hypothetical protein